MVSVNRCFGMAELCFAEHEFWIPGPRLVYVVKSLTNTLGQEPAEIGHSQTWHEAWVHGVVCILLESTLKSCPTLVQSERWGGNVCMCDCSAVWFTVFSNYVREELTVPRVEQTTSILLNMSSGFVWNECGFYGLSAVRFTENWRTLVENDYFYVNLRYLHNWISLIYTCISICYHNLFLPWKITY